MILAALLWPLNVSADTGIPSEIELNSEQRQKALSGEVVVQQVEDTDVHLMASVYVQASPDVVMKAVMDLPPRLNEVENLESLEPYDVGRHIAARWTINVVVTSVQFFVIYECDWEAFYCNYALDPSKENQVPASKGSYRVRAEGQGSWLEYHSYTTPAGWIPAPLRRTKSEASARQMLGGMKKRAESGG